MPIAADPQGFLFFNLIAALYSIYQYLFDIVKDGAQGLQGDFLCHGMYYVAAVMYKPLTLNMMWLLTVCTTYAFTHIFYDQSPRERHRRDGLGTPYMAPVPRNRLTIAIVAVVSVAYMAWCVTAAVVVGPIIVVFIFVLLIPALVLPLVAMHYFPMLVTEVVEWTEFVLGVGRQSPLEVGDEVEVAGNPKETSIWGLNPRPVRAYVTHVYPGWLYRLFRGDRYNVEVTDEAAVKRWRIFEPEQVPALCIIKISNNSFLTVNMPHRTVPRRAAPRRTHFVLNHTYTLIKRAGALKQSCVLELLP